MEKVEKWHMYMQIKQLHEVGYSERKIAKHLGISRTTVTKYLKKGPEEMAVWLASTKSRARKLDKYEKEILAWLQKYPDTTAAMVHDRLEENYSDFSVAESTVRSYVNDLRNEYRIPKTVKKRNYEAVPECPMGSQAQVDFGECWQKDRNGKLIKLYVVAFVLSHSRYKYMEWIDHPFRTRDLIEAHERAFRYFNGKPEEMVYDQDNIIVVSENHGEINFTSQFESYRQKEKFRVYACRGYDPESKGKIENVIGFIKKNFAKHRLFTDLEEWNHQALKWLERRGNGKIHNTTKKRPVDVFQKEKQFLRPVNEFITAATNDKTQLLSTSSSITRTVRKDNTIMYLSNRYSVPLGTYQALGKEIQLKISQGNLVIYDPDNGEILGEHQLSKEKGRLIQDKNHLRDRSKGIPEMMASTIQKFDDKALAEQFVLELKKKYPRYIRDQLQLVNQQWEHFPPLFVNNGLRHCVEENLYSGSELKDMIAFLVKFSQSETLETFEEMGKKTKALNDEMADVLEIKPPVRSLETYLPFMKGGPEA